MNKNLENYDSVQVADSYPHPTIGDHENINFSENAPCGLLTLTPDGGIFYINLIGAELIGAEENLSERPTFIEYIDPDYHGAMVQALQNTVATGKPQTAELKTVDTQDRRPLWLRADVSARIEAKGHLSQWQISLVNITETQTRYRRLERELEKKKLLMRELNHRIANNLMMITSLIMQKEAEVGR
ncbi:MAG TPA: PAS domain-containing protein, partial [Clostridia bacterium]|nr:PAS domain-containing protein [Clostridia bacterium]